ncbi:Cytoplasmic and mitochondrial histidine tRNA synthetase [Sporothrix eucalyptigena]|uniref:histidine--tRNA ligase n=1 Tax=Sporothrix eucalyptigena TaxID=1812306 RepID=A0ABP0B463_9PEZI
MGGGQGEMLQKGLAKEAVDRIGKYVQRRGSLKDPLDELRQDTDLRANETSSEGVADLALLDTYLDAMGIFSTISFDLSLARGLDYYPGVIYEVTHLVNRTQVGGTAAGGRYDNLVGMHGKKPVPCEKDKKKALKAVTEVFVIGFGGDGLLAGRMKVVTKLWNAGIRAEHPTKVRLSKAQQFRSADKSPVVVVKGPGELAEGKVRIKASDNCGDAGGNAEKGGKGEEKDKSSLVAKDNLVEEVRKLLDAVKVDAA